jgi:hypothetical protein
MSQQNTPDQICSDVNKSNASPTADREADPHEPIIARSFDPTEIKNYPRSNRKVPINFGAYSLMADESSMESGQSMHIAPSGIEFQTSQPFLEGALLKIMVHIPDYWQRKCRFVEYRRIDQPARFAILAKVVRTEDVGRRGKKKIITVQTVSIDETDELVLKSFLQEG